MEDVCYTLIQRSSILAFHLWIDITGFQDGKSFGSNLGPAHSICVSSRYEVGLLFWLSVSVYYLRNIGP